MSDSNRPGFNLIMKVNHDITKTWLWACGLLLVIALGVGKFSSYSGGFFMKVLGFFAFLMITFVAILMGIYIFRLYFTERNRLELNEEGLYDFGSFCELGFVPMTSIANIRFAHLLGQQFLLVDFFSHVNPLRTKQGVSAEVYRLLFGLELWVPVGLFRMSRIDLESQLIHLDHLLQEKAGGSPSTTNSGKIRPPAPNAKVSQTNPLAGLAGANVDPLPSTLPSPPASMAGRAAAMDQAPPPLTQVRPEKARVLEKINAIKQQVKQRGFDVKLATLYLDQVAMFPTLYVAGQLPEGVTNVQSSQQGSDYEEVRFQYAGQSFSFGLRRDIGSSDEALLSVGVGDRVHLSLRVRVEIGELVPMDLESFIPGDWQGLLEKLIQAIQESQVVKLDMTQKISMPEQTKTNLEELKNRFGIKE
ncbi:MAG: hypothetical protein AB7N80_11210 [Bdellovibrionales bacterium]